RGANQRRDGGICARRVERRAARRRVGEGPGPGGQMKRILVIDDDLETCNFLTEIFAEEGWEVASSQTAEAAREAVHNTHFDLIVSDINLGGRTTGVALLKEFKSVSPASEVILISGFGTLETAVEAVREGAFDYVSKPF